MNQTKKALTHYFNEVNPYKTVNSLSDLIHNNLIYNPDNKVQIAFLNKPPGLNLTGSKHDL
jgi:hypothetical protein